MSSFVVNPKLAQAEITRPVVVWSGAEPVGREEWQGVLSASTVVKQVELRHKLEGGVTMVVRLNIGDQATDAKGRELDAGVVISRNKSGVSIALSWKEFWEMLAAVDEGIVRLGAEQEDTYAQLGAKWMGNLGDWSPESAVEGDKPA